MAITKYTDPGVSPRTNVYAEMKMLEHAEPIIVLDKMAKALKMPKNKTQTIKFRRPIPFDAATTPLVEGVTPTATAMRFEDVSVSLAQYGMQVIVTDVIEDTHEDPVMLEASAQAGENIGRTKEALDYGVVRAGTNVYYANGTARTAVNTAITLSAQRAVTRFLQVQKAKYITKTLDPALEYGTRAVQAAYVAVGHTDLNADIRNLPGFTPVAEYGSMKPICPQEIGSVEDVRYVMSADLSPFEDAGGAAGTSVLSTSGTSADVYPLMFFGMDAWGTVALKGQGAVSPTIISAGVRTKDDPLGQRGVVAWKTWHAGLILNQGWMCRLEVAASKLL
jgi:N4-gp56 family major capsid protein